MLLKDLITNEPNVTILCKGFIDFVLSRKRKATLYPYLNEQAINDVCGLIMYILKHMSVQHLVQLYQFGDDLDTLFTEMYSDDIIDVPWGELSISTEVAHAIITVSNLINTWRLNNGWENPGWVTTDMGKYSNIIVTHTNEPEYIPKTAKNPNDQIPPYVLTTETINKSTIVLIMQPNKKLIYEPLRTIALKTLGLNNDDDSLQFYPSVGIGVTTASILCYFLQYFRIPIKQNVHESNFEWTLKIVSQFSKIIRSNIRILTPNDCHPRLQKHSVIKYVNDDIMISIAKIMETSF